jgi:hypothetical protein
MNLENATSNNNFSSNVSLKEKLENYFTKNDNVILKSISWVIAQNDSNTEKFESELALELPFLDYKVAKKCYSLILANPDIQKQYNFAKINEVIENWLITCEVVNKSFKKNHPQKFQSSHSNILGRIETNALEELKKRRGLEDQRKKGFRDQESLRKNLTTKYQYSKKQANTIIQQLKRRSYVSNELANKESVEQTLQYIDKYIGSEERKKIEKKFFEIMQKYKLFDSSAVETKKFNYKKTLKIVVPLTIIIGTVALFFFLVIVIGAIMIS